jgi:ubiquinone/menaquinone biosynthesis C-methylase UbiE
MEVRKQREKEFHDRLRQVNEDIHVADTRWSPELEETIKNNPMWVNMKYYSIERQSRAMILDWFQENCKGKRVLDYCCGNGEDGVFIAQNGAREVVGIDISDVSIANCQELARKNGVEKITSYQVGDAENTGFEDNCFDVITEYGALHHLDLERAFAEMSRILKPDGKIICNEALGHNLVINAYRRLTPHLRTEWEVEHILRKESFEVARKYFDKVDIHFYYLFTLLAVPFRKLPIFEPVLSILEKIDNVILKLPLIKWQAWQIVFVLSEPRKTKKPGK